MGAKPSRAQRPTRKRLTATLQQAVALHRAGRVHDAVPLLQAAAREAPKRADVQFLLGASLFGLKRLEDARAPLEAAVALDRAHHSAHFQLGLLHYGARRFEAARASFGTAARIAPKVFRYHRELARVCADMSDHDGAWDAARRAAVLQPGDGQVQLLLARACRARGDVAGEARHYGRAATVDGHQAETLYNLTRAGRLDDADHLRACATDAQLSVLDRSLLAFALGEVLQRRGEHAEAFAAFAEGNRLMPTQHDNAARARATDRTIEICDRAYFEERRGWGDPTEAPVFIVGMPRSGSSLVEQILAAHPEVRAFGERSSIVQFTLGARRPFPGLMDMLGSKETARLAARYLAEVPHRGAVRIVDKGLSNFLYLGLIATLFPNARILHTRRDPVDVCFSAYTGCFGPDRLHFSYDMHDLVAFYRDYERVMRHWREVLPLRMYEVDYETLVHGGADEMRRIVDFVGLPWTDACANFHELDRACLTASRYQVQEPLHTRACGRWKPYERFIGPLLELRAS